MRKSTQLTVLPWTTDWGPVINLSDFIDWSSTYCFLSVRFQGGMQLVSTSWRVSSDTKSDLYFEFEMEHRLDDNRIPLDCLSLDEN